MQRNLPFAAHKGHRQASVGLAQSLQYVRNGASAHGSGLPGPKDGCGPVLHPGLKNQGSAGVHHQHYRLAGFKGFAHKVLLYWANPKGCTTTAFTRLVSVLANGQNQDLLRTQRLQGAVVAAKVRAVQG